GHFGRPGRGGGAPVGDEIDQGGVGLVPHGGNDRDAGGGDCAGQAFVVEAPQILDRAAAAGDDQQVWPGQGAAGGHGVEAADGVGDLAAGGLALDDHWPDDDPAGPALGDAVQDVADHRPGRTGDDPDAGGEGRDRLLASGVEQSLALQLDLE